ncbi:MAG: iron ABC transporter permease [Coriobacteriia bacterium]|nr:iron ABC transporter permease [Coriobacteriia bacterium]MBS5478915.1 iron ABC transporter permease [Coriobacteriia bacterium]
MGEESQGSQSSGTVSPVLTGEALAAGESTKSARRQHGARLPFTIVMIALIAILVFVYLASFMIGSANISLGEVWDILRSHIMPVEQYWEDVLDKIMTTVRFPQITLSVLIGGALAVSGASYQTVFKNPMVSSDILGVSAGAGFGAALAMLNGGNWWEIQISAFVCGVAAVTIAYVIGAIFGKQNLTILVLAGVVVSSFFQALISIIKTVADTESVLPSITFWLMGSLNKGDNTDLLVMLPATIASLVLLFIFRNKIDVLAAGEDEARAMGVNVVLVKGVVIVASTLMTACAVSVAGIIGWIGMVVPHIARTVTGASYSKLIAGSFVIGGLFLVLIDDLVRSAFSDLPIGVLTALIGTPLFVFLLIKTKREWL